MLVPGPALQRASISKTAQGIVRAPRIVGSLLAAMVLAACGSDSLGTKGASDSVGGSAPEVFVRSAEFRGNGGDLGCWHLEYVAASDGPVLPDDSYCTNSPEWLASVGLPVTVLDAHDPAGQQVLLWVASSYSVQTPPTTTTLSISDQLLLLSFPAGTGSADLVVSNGVSTLSCPVEVQVVYHSSLCTSQ